MSQPEPVNATLQYVEGCPNWVESTIDYARHWPASDALTPW